MNPGMAGLLSGFASSIGNLPQLMLAKEELGMNRRRMDMQEAEFEWKKKVADREWEYKTGAQNLVKGGGGLDELLQHAAAFGKTDDYAELMRLKNWQTKHEADEEFRDEQMDLMQNQDERAERTLTEGTRRWNIENQRAEDERTEGIRRWDIENERAQESHQLSMDIARNTDARATSAENRTQEVHDWQMSEREFASGKGRKADAQKMFADQFLAITGGDPNQVYAGLPDMNRLLRSAPHLAQKAFNLPGHRIPLNFEARESPNGERILALNVFNTRLKRSGPATRNATSDPEDSVITIRPEYLNRLMHTWAGAEMNTDDPLGVKSGGSGGTTNKPFAAYRFEQDKETGEWIRMNQVTGESVVMPKSEATQRRDASKMVSDDINNITKAGAYAQLLNDTIQLRSVAGYVANRALDMGAKPEGLGQKVMTLLTNQANLEVMVGDKVMTLQRALEIPDLRQYNTILDQLAAAVAPKKPPRKPEPRRKGPRLGGGIGSTINRGLGAVAPEGQGMDLDPEGNQPPPMPGLPPELFDRYAEDFGPYAP